MSKPYNNALVAKAHDVRTLRPCVCCKGLGNSDSMLHERMHEIGHVEKVFVHGRCFIKELGMPAFLALPRVETDKLRLDDIGVEAMKALLDRRAGRSRKERRA